MHENQHGFTLVELLVVVTTIGILAAIAIPAFFDYRQRSFNARLINDLKNAATGEEAYFTTTEQYTDCIGVASCESTLPGFRGSPGTWLSMYQIPVSGAVPEHFTGQAYHPQSSWSSLGTARRWNSHNGGLQ